MWEVSSLLQAATRQRLAEIECSLPDYCGKWDILSITIFSNRNYLSKIVVQIVKWMGVVKYWVEMEVIKPIVRIIRVERIIKGAM